MLQFLKNWIGEYRHKKILEVIEIPKQGTVLDLSCGDGGFLNRLHYLSPNLELFGVDISGDDIEKAKVDFPEGTFLREDVEQLSFADHTFDIVFSTMSLHHYKNLEKVLREAERVLKPNGVLYLTDMIPKYKWTQKIHNLKGCPEPYHFEKYYSVSDLETILESFGLMIISDNRISCIPRVRILKVQNR